MYQEEFLNDLLGRMTVSGMEESGSSCICTHMEAVSDEIRVDDMGNTVCILNPDYPYKILATAHLDEIGLMVTHITDGGRLLVLDRGGIIPATYPGHPVLVSGHLGIISGVVESYRDLFEKESMKISDLLVDIGVDSREEAEALVSLGAALVQDSPVRKLAGGRFCGRGFDDRLGVFIIMEALKRAGERGCKHGIYCGATVGEETTKNGAYWTASRVKPDVAVVVDVTYTSDAPGMNTADGGEVMLGKGPVLCNSPIVAKRLNDKMYDLAKGAGIPVQTEAASKLSYTDADRIHFALDGIPVVLLSIPLRNMHHPAEVADERDVEWSIELLTEFFVKHGEDIENSLGYQRIAGRRKR